VSALMSAQEPGNMMGKLEDLRRWGAAAIFAEVQR
jgi:hypothetical protein